MLSFGREPAVSGDYPTKISKQRIRVASVDENSIGFGSMVFVVASIYADRPFLRRDNGMDRASLDPKALLAQKPERPALHRGRRSASCGWHWDSNRFADRDGACYIPHLVPNIW